VTAIPIVRDALIVACDAVIADRDHLSRLDAIAGDGDLGATMAVGFGHVRDRLGREGFEDLGQLLSAVADELARHAPSTLGTLFGAAFRKAATVNARAQALSAPDLAGVLESACDAVRELGGAVEGQRSVLDAMGPSSRAARSAAESGAAVNETARAASVAAWVGVEATAGMRADVGRAAWVGGRAEGSQDAGATAWANLLTGLADGLERHGAASDTDQG
jgi:dihydroxyacetone kinase